jgi:hypothetical protein
MMHICDYRYRRLFTLDGPLERVIQLSGVWSEVYQAYLQAKILPEVGTQGSSGENQPEKAA